MFRALRFTLHPFTIASVMFLIATLSMDYLKHLTNFCQNILYKNFIAECTLGGMYGWNVRSLVHVSVIPANSFIRIKVMSNVESFRFDL